MSVSVRYRFTADAPHHLTPSMGVILRRFRLERDLAPPPLVLVAA